MKQLKAFGIGIDKYGKNNKKYVVYGYHDKNGGTELTCIGREEERQCKKHLRNKGYKEVGSWESTQE